VLAASLLEDHGPIEIAVVVKQEPPPVYPSQDTQNETVSLM
jgi:hypothetical protein